VNATTGALESQTAGIINSHKICTYLSSIDATALGPDYVGMRPKLSRNSAMVIQSGDITASDLLNTTASFKPLDWLGLILLLDQVPRNCYRGSKAKVAFNVSDPIAIAITLWAIEEGILTRPRSVITWDMACVLSPSEKLEIHELSMKEQARIFTGMKDLITSSDEAVGGDLELKECRKFLLENRDIVGKWEYMLVDFARRRKIIIDRFGRYPHRNQALDRESTAEAAKYLAQGGEIFGSG